MTKLILASASPRRRQMLSDLGIPFQIMVSEADENCKETDPCRYAEEISQKKASAVLRLVCPDQIVIACDTVVAMQDQILGKPKDGEDAKRMLRMLSGKRHRVISALTVANAQKSVTKSVVTDVTFREITAAEIEAYVASGEPMDKAGAYGIQGLGGLFVLGINGDWNTVVGMPLAELKLILKNDFDVDFFALRDGIE